MIRCAAAVAIVLGSTAARAQPPAVDLTGWAQVDAVPWSQDSQDQLDPAGQPLNLERVLVRRARIRASAERGPWAGLVEVDGNTVDGAVARLLAAEVTWRAPVPEVELEIAAGLFKIPFGAEVPLPDRSRDFFEPSRAARSLFPGNYDAGVAVRGAWRLIRWSIAAMNGAPVADAQFRGHDPTHSFDLLGRVGVEAAGCGWSVAAGFSGLTGRGLSPGEPPTKDQIIWIDANENGLVDSLTEIQVISGDPGTPSVTFPHRALGGDVRVRWWAKWIGWGEAIAEVVIATNLDRGLLIADPRAQSRDLRELGWHVGAVQGITDHALVGVRLDRYQPDRDAHEVEGAMLVGIDPTWTTLAVLAGYRHGTDARVVVEYDHERNPLGRADDGSPITRSADRITLRGQVGF